jgi:beta-lactamase class A
MSKKYLLITSVAGIMLMLIGVIVGRTVFTNTQSSKTQEYPLLAKRLFIENPNDTRINFSPLRKELNTYVKENNIKGSVYFEYLPTGTSIRINPDVRYRAASLMKLPVAMELYKASENGKVNLDDTIQLKQEWLNNGYGTLYEKGVGYTLTLREAAEILLAESDNTALRAILASTEGTLDTSELALGSLDVEFTLNEDDSIDIGTRSYSSFFKCLYFACYNTKENSQEILTMLTKSPDTDRIVAGVGDNATAVAHKIGVFNTQVQSDCGIVYVENNNYVLCIMLEGDDSQVSNDTFKTISDKVYTFVTNKS